MKSLGKTLYRSLMRCAAQFDNNPVNKAFITAGSPKSESQFRKIKDKFLCNASLFWPSLNSAEDSVRDVVRQAYRQENTDLAGGSSETIADSKALQIDEAFHALRNLQHILSIAKRSVGVQKEQSCSQGQHAAYAEHGTDIDSIQEQWVENAKGKLKRQFQPKPGYLLVVHPTQASSFEQKLVLITETSLSGGSQGLCLNNHEDFGARLERETAEAWFREAAGHTKSLFARLQNDDVSEADSTSGDSVGDSALVSDDGGALGMYTLESSLVDNDFLNDNEGLQHDSSDGDEEPQIFSGPSTARQPFLHIHTGVATLPVLESGDWAPDMGLHITPLHSERFSLSESGEVLAQSWETDDDASTESNWDQHLQSRSEHHASIASNKQSYYGGPVNDSDLTVLHTSPELGGEAIPNTLLYRGFAEQQGSGQHLSPAESQEAIANANADVAKYYGVVRWEMMQLENELADGQWLMFEIAPEALIPPDSSKSSLEWFLRLPTWRSILRAAGGPFKDFATIQKARKFAEELREVE